MRTKSLTVLVGGLLIAAAAVPLVATGSTSPRQQTQTRKPAIKTEEVGYFGNGVVAHQVSVFVYSTSGRARANT